MAMCHIDEWGDEISGADHRPLGQIRASALNPEHLAEAGDRETAHGVG